MLRAGLQPTQIVESWVIKNMTHTRKSESSHSRKFLAELSQSRIIKFLFQSYVWVIFLMTHDSTTLSRLQPWIWQIYGAHSATFTVYEPDFSPKMQEDLPRLIQAVLTAKL